VKCPCGEDRNLLTFEDGGTRVCVKNHIYHKCRGDGKTKYGFTTVEYKL